MTAAASVAKQRHATTSSSQQHGHQAPSTASADSPIAVYVRIRPNDPATAATSSSAASSNQNFVTKATDTRLRLSDAKSGHQRTYTFDHVFGPADGQQTLYERTTEPVLSEVLNGYSCTIFAYGQTGTGKTYTMTGDHAVPERCGIIPRALHSLFAHLQAEAIKEHVVR